MSSSSLTRFSRALPALATRLASFFAAFLETFLRALAGLRACFFIMPKVVTKAASCQAARFPVRTPVPNRMRRITVERLIDQTGSALGQIAVYRAFDHRAFEEIRIDRGPQTGRIAEYEIAEILGRGHFFLDHFVGLLQHFQHVGHVEMAYIRAEYGV